MAVATVSGLAIGSPLTIACKDLQLQSHTFLVDHNFCGVIFFKPFPICSNITCVPNWNTQIIRAEPKASTISNEAVFDLRYGMGLQS